MKTLESERLILRKWDISDYLDLFEMATNPLVVDNSGNSTINTIEEAKRIVETYIKVDRAYAIVHKFEK